MSENLQILGSTYNNVNEIKVNNINGQTISYIKEPVFIEKYVDSNGIYNAKDDNADGYIVADVNIINIEELYGEKTITQDGVYYASNDGLYGYSKVVVEGEVVGEDPDGSGDTAVATVDEETNKIVVKKVPESIRITTLPNKIIYNEGDTIDYTGIIVKLYDKKNELFSNKKYKNGIIPRSELITPLKIAHYDWTILSLYTTPADDTSVYYKRTGYTFHFTEVDTPFTLDRKSSNRKYVYTCDGRLFVMRWQSSTGALPHDYVQVASPSTIYLDYTNEHGYTRRTVYAPRITYADANYRYANPSSVQTGRDEFKEIPEAWPRGQESTTPEYLSRDMAYFGSGQPPAGTQIIPVKWLNPYTDKELLMEFSITVNSILENI